MTDIVQKRVAIIGAGTMGHGIAAIAATAGYLVSITDARAEILPTAFKHITSTLDAGVKRGKLTAQDRDAALARVNLRESIVECVSDANIIIEAVPERLDLKQALFNEIDTVAPFFNERSVILESA